MWGHVVTALGTEWAEGDWDGDPQPDGLGGATLVCRADAAWSREAA